MNLLLMSVFDIDSEEGKAENNSHGGGNTQRCINCRIDSRLLNPGVGPVLWWFSSVLGPHHSVASLHVKSSATKLMFKRTCWLLLLEGLTL